MKDILNFCNAAIFYDYRDESVSDELNQVRKYINNSFYKTILNSTLPTSLSIIDDIILKNSDNDIEKINDNIHDLGENILYMLPFGKLIKDNNGELLIGDDNDIE